MHVLRRVLPLGLVLLALAGCKDQKTNLPFTFASTPQDVVRGPTAIFFTLTTDGSSALVSVEVSVDDGNSFNPATEASGQPNPQTLAGAPAGMTQYFYWDPRADLEPGIYRRVIVRVAGLGRELGLISQTGPFTVDLTDRLDPLPAGPAPALSRPLATPLADGRVWLTGGLSAGNLNSSGWFFDPRTAQLTAANGLISARQRPGAALLADGRSLVAGGFDAGGAPVNLVETLRVFSSGTQGVSEASLQVARGAPALAALPDGRGAVLGGQVAGGGSTPTVELITPGASATASFSDPAAARREASATALLDGRVLLAGGFDDADQPLAAVALLDAAGTALSAGSSLSAPRGEHAALRLPDGRVVLVGGTTRLGDDGSALSSVEVFNPDTGSFSSLPSMSRRRRNPALVYTGGALVAFGGSGSTDAPTTAERLDLDASTWADVAGPSGTARPQAVAVATGNGLTLVAGGDQPVERYTPDATDSGESFDALGSVPRPRADHTATLLSNGEVLLVGGTAGISSATASVEVYRPLPFNRFEDRADLLHARAQHAAALVGGQVLVAGGADQNGPVAEAELYDSFSDRWTAAGSLAIPRRDPTLTLMGDGRVLVAGGTDASGSPVAQLEAWDPSTRTFSSAGTLQTARSDHDAIGVGFFGENTLIGPGAGASGPVADVDLVLGLGGSVNHVLGANPRAGAALGEVPLGSGVVTISGGVDASGTRGDLVLLDTRQLPPVFLGQPRTLQVPRSRQRAVTLTNISGVLLVGGLNARGGPTDENEVFVVAPFAAPETGSTRRTIDHRAHRARARHTATRLADGRVLIVGGVDERGVVIAGAEVFVP